ncbi:MAG: NUDIX domain-containing protein [Anaerolineaceae bacterium]|nr:NUDIX domain-containing protein [Anaerolineaceae bacterium]
MRYKYCPNCGSKLSEIQSGDDGMVPYCVHCGKRWFDSFHSCVVVLTYNEFNEIALSKQWYLPEQYMSVTTGYIVPGESAEEAAKREVREELGLTLENVAYAGTFWLEECDQLLHGFIGYSTKRPFALSGEISFAEWVPAKQADEKFFPDKPGGALYEVYHKFLKDRGLES